MHGESEAPGGGALVPRASGSSELAEANPFQTGGIGLYDHADRDPFPRSVGWWAGATGLVLTAIVLNIVWARRALKRARLEARRRVAMKDAT